MSCNTAHAVAVSTGSSHRILQEIQTDGTREGLSVQLIFFLCHLSSQRQLLSDSHFPRSASSLSSDLNNTCLKPHSYLYCVTCWLPGREPGSLSTEAEPVVKDQGGVIRTRSCTQAVLRDNENLNIKPKKTWKHIPAEDNTTHLNSPLVSLFGTSAS